MFCVFFCSTLVFSISGLLVYVLSLLAFLCTKMMFIDINVFSISPDIMLLSFLPIIDQLYFMIFLVIILSDR